MTTEEVTKFAEASFATNHDVSAVAEHDPEAFAVIAQLEQRIGFTMKPGTQPVADFG